MSTLNNRLAEYQSLIDAETAACDETFLVTIGESPGPSASFTLHKGIVSFYSRWFAAALKKDTFKEGHESHISIAPYNEENIEEEIEDFRNFKEWVYTRKFVDPGYGPNLQHLHQGPRYPSIRLWIFADRYEVPLLANYMIDWIHSDGLRTSTFPADALPFVYDRTPPRSPLRRFFIRSIFTAFELHSFTESEKEAWPRDALSDFLTLAWGYLGDDLKYDPNDISDLCEFHIHAEGERCKRKDKKASKALEETKQ